MSTGKLKNMKLKVCNFWGENCPTNDSEDRIPTMLGTASQQRTFGYRKLCHLTKTRTFLSDRLTVMRSSLSFTANLP